jgi:hypothetical protein
MQVPGMRGLRRRAALSPDERRNPLKNFAESLGNSTGISPEWHPNSLGKSPLALLP